MIELSVDSFIDRLNSTEEGKEYLRIVREQQQSSTNKRQKGYEKHHIHPKALGGSDEPENLVYLTKMCHCIVHALLAKAIPCTETFYVIRRLSNSQFRELSELDKLTVEDAVGWGKLKEQAFRLGPSEETRRKMSEAHKGQSRPKTLEQRLAISQRMKGKTLSESTKRKISETKKSQHLTSVWKGKTFSEEHRKHLSEAHKGNVSGMQGKKHSKETLERMSIVHKNISDETRKKMSEAQKGRKRSKERNLRAGLSMSKLIWICNRDGRRRVRLEEIQSFLDQGWQKGRIFRTE